MSTIGSALRENVIARDCGGSFNLGAAAARALMQINAAFGCVAGAG